MARILLTGSLILAFVFSSTAQSQVTGYITDDLGEPLIGATVKMEGTAIGSVTGTDGFYRLGSIPAGSYTMVASFIGLKTVKKDITLEKPGRLSIDFQLKEAISELDEILIVGKTESTELSEQPMTINSLDTKPVLAQGKAEVWEVMLTLILTGFQERLSEFILMVFLLMYLVEDCN